MDDEKAAKNRWAMLFKDAWATAIPAAALWWALDVPIAKALALSFGAYTLVALAITRRH